MSIKRRSQRWTDRWQGFYDAVTHFFPTLPMAKRADMADEYIGKNLPHVDLDVRVNKLSRTVEDYS